MQVAALAQGVDFVDEACGKHGVKALFYALVQPCAAFWLKRDEQGGGLGGLLCAAVLVQARYGLTCDVPYL